MKSLKPWRQVARAVVIAAILGTSLAVGPAVNAASAQGEYYGQLMARHSGKCLDLTDYSMSNGAYLQQYDCHFQSNQYWWLKPVIFTQAGTYYEIISKLSGKCVDIEGASLANRARAQQYTCHGGDNQLFLETRHGDGPSYVARHSGKCLDVEGDYLTNKAKVWQYTCDWDLNQQWSFFPV